jgi:hypothetical protein
LTPLSASRPEADSERNVLIGIGWPAQWLPWVLAALAGAYGLLARLWLLAHLPLFSDEAVVGLMGRGILAGRLDAFYWGQNYGGGEPYVVAAVLSRVNGGPMGLNATPAVLSGIAAVLTYAVFAGSGVNRRLAVSGAAMVWVWPYAAEWNSVREIGFRGVTLCCGLLLVFCAVRVHRHTAGAGTRLLLGLAAGVGWWASPEIVYFAVPAAVLMVAGWDRLYRPASSAAPSSADEGRRQRWAGPWRAAPLLLTGIGAAVGALPWLYANFRSGFASLRLGTAPPAGFDYLTRVSLFFRDVLPTQLGLRGVPGGAWVGGPAVGRSLFGVALAVVVLPLGRAVMAARRGRTCAPLFAAAAAVVAFPFLYAAFPTSWYWADGRYGVYLPPLIVLLAVWSLPSVVVPAGALPTHAIRRPPRARIAVALASIGLVAGTFSTVVIAQESAGVPTGPASFFSGWSDPDTAVRQVVRSLSQHHVHTAYGDYWTAYVLDFLGPRTVAVSPSPLDDQRSIALARVVADSTPQAWLFFAPGHAAEAAAAFSNPEPGPDNYSQPAFTAYLTSRGIGYRVVHLGLLNAVVPDRPVRHLPSG